MDLRTFRTLLEYAWAHVSIVFSKLDTEVSKLTPFNADLAAELACLPALPLVAAPIMTYASAIALEELAISAAAGAQFSPSFYCWHMV